ncbi:heterokaryon incompatibility protein-domain-containing protein [Colletotrichum phormii]|uniref:Heterokaryon incompatibility protein-domain-containing protein n=1 Tax=Colletotrichum phormii TaxID=359342 RepID=A0AAJ0EDC6_9PEZI|nr:heterokaryon incompatibility protein-domain-containing protein [Colletotrichum phormii]KAK1634568.1 heterokaryon incompatibility protein-domain-containing protein [Colletotrichum phormii]
MVLPATLGDICSGEQHLGWMRGALQRRSLCARCHNVLADSQHLAEAISDAGLLMQVAMIELYESAELHSCRMCSVFLYMWTMSKFVKVHGAYDTVLKVRALLRPIDQRASDCDIHEMLVFGKLIGSGVELRYHNESHLRFKVYAEEGEEAAAFVSSVDADGHFNSEAAFSRVRSCMSTCDEQHTDCLRDSTGIRPSRLLDLSITTTMRLRDAHVTYDQYAALSYCWGGDQQLKITRSTLAQIPEAYLGIDLASLSATIQDAVRVARRFGVDYLWVDALCIVQDSPEDREVEMSKMASIYQNACITIVAANASDASRGFLASRDSPRSLEPGSLPLRFQLPITLEGKVQNIGLEYSKWDNALSPEPIDKRAWAFQESLLSRRVLIYGTSTMTWRCGSGVQAWRSWIREHQKTMATWKNLVTLYGRRLLTCSEDRLPAISALASEVLRLTKEGGGEPGRYLAGVWENDLLNQLIWFTNLEEGRDVRRIPYRAPSWSWASVESPILYSLPRIAMTASEIMGDSDTDLEIIECGVTLLSERAPMGEVIGGKLCARGSLVPGSSMPDHELWGAGTFQNAPDKYQFSRLIHVISTTESKFSRNFTYAHELSPGG